MQIGWSRERGACVQLFKSGRKSGGERLNGKFVKNVKLLEKGWSFCHLSWIIEHARKSFQPKTSRADGSKRSSIDKYRHLNFLEGSVKRRTLNVILIVLTESLFVGQKVGIISWQGLPAQTCCCVLIPIRRRITMKLSYSWAVMKVAA